VTKFRLYSLTRSFTCIVAVVGIVVAAVPNTPSNLQVAEGERLRLTAFARGVQMYLCQPLAEDPDGFEWAYQAPEATLMDEAKRSIGSHYAGPTWEADDGSKVVAEVRASTDSPGRRAIPQLLLEAVSNEGEGVLSEITSIQRLHTVGGVAPRGGCDASQVDTEVRVPYTARYYFYDAP